MKIELNTLPGSSALFKDYVSGKKSTLQLFTHSPLADESISTLSADLKNRDYDRKDLSSILLEQNKQWGADKTTLKNCRRLAEKNCLAVVTGQQVGFLGGPLYTLIKALHTIKLSESLEDRLGTPVVPIFWLELEDHDLEEVTAYTIKNHQGKILTQKLETEKVDENYPVNKVLIGESLNETLDTLEKQLNKTEFSNDMFEHIRQSYNPEVTLAEGFGKFFTSYLSKFGLILADPSHAHFKKRVSMVFIQEIYESLTSTRKFNEHAELILSMKYHNQVMTNGDKLNLFLLDGSQKLRIIKSGEFFILNDPSEIISRDDLLNVAQSEPHRLIPSVLLRPLVQDTLFPTIAYVAGPAEIAYFAQLKPAYEKFDIPMPMIVPRSGITLIGGNAKRSIKKYSIETLELLQPSKQLLRHVLAEHVPCHADLLFNWVREEIKSTLHRLKSELDTGEGGFAKAVSNSEQKIDYHINKLQNRYLKDMENKHEVVVRHINNLANTVYPNEKLQERVFTLVEFINQFGPEIINIVYQAIDPLKPSHDFVEV